jgi:preprotein translocase subunit YajC
MNWFVSEALAQTEGGRPGGFGGLVGFLPLVLIFALFYMLILRPQQKKQRDHQKLVEALKKGDRVVTNGGIYATVIGVKGDIVVLKVADNVKMEFQKTAITQVNPAE